MVTELIVFPDAVVATIEALNDQLVELGYEEVPVAGRVPDPRPARFVRVLRVGGAREGLVIDQAMLVVEAWAETAYESHSLAQAARAVVNAMAGTVVDGVTIYRVTELAGPANLPDPESTQQRHTSTVTVSCRGRVSDPVLSS